MSAQVAYLVMLVVVALPFIGVLTLMVLWWLGKLDRPFPPGYCAKCGQWLHTRAQDPWPHCGYGLSGLPLVGTISASAGVNVDAAGALRRRRDGI